MSLLPGARGSVRCGHPTAGVGRGGMSRRRDLWDCARGRRRTSMARVGQIGRSRVTRDPASPRSLAMTCLSEASSRRYGRAPSVPND
jgi:hypothetical protein